MARHAVFTIVQDDPTNLLIWAQYYRKTYAALDTFVLHHPRIGERFDAEWVMRVGQAISAEHSDNAFMLVPGVFREESFNHTWLRETVQAFQRFLLQSYDTVLFTEIDEIVAVDPRSGIRGGLRNYLDAFAVGDAPCVQCNGYEVVHDFAVEPPIDYAKPLLKQRTFWYPSTQYSKTLLSKIPLVWVNGFHQPDPAHDDYYRRVDPWLLLLHLHKLDFGHALERHKRSAAQKWSKHDAETGQGGQNRIADEAWLRNWWLNTIDSPTTRAKWAKMPQEVKGIL